MATPTLAEWAGGPAAIERLTSVFYREVHHDPLIGPLFAHVGDAHAHHVAQWLTEVFRGPAEYSAEHGGYPTMVRHHLGLRITEEQRARWVSLIGQAADAAGLPDDPEFRSAFHAYIEWGSRIGKENSQDGAAPPLAAPMPHWGWGEAPPFSAAQPNA